MPERNLDNGDLRNEDNLDVPIDERLVFEISLGRQKPLLKALLSKGDQKSLRKMLSGLDCRATRTTRTGLKESPRSPIDSIG